MTVAGADYSERVHRTVTRAHAVFTSLITVPAVCSYVNAVQFKGGATAGIFEHAVSATFMAWFWGVAVVFAVTKTGVADLLHTRLPPPLRMFTYGWFVTVSAVGMTKAVLNPAADTMSLLGLCLCASIYMARAPLHTVGGGGYVKGVPRGRSDATTAILAAYSFSTIPPAVCSFVNAQLGEVRVSAVAMYCMWGIPALVCAAAVGIASAWGRGTPSHTVAFAIGCCTLLATVGVLKTAFDPTGDCLPLCLASACAAMHLVRGGEVDALRVAHRASHCTAPHVYDRGGRGADIGGDDDDDGMGEADDM